MRPRCSCTCRCDGALRFGLLGVSRSGHEVRVLDVRLSVSEPDSTHIKRFRNRIVHIFGLPASWVFSSFLVGGLPQQGTHFAWRASASQRARDAARRELIASPSPTASGSSARLAPRGHLRAHVHPLLRPGDRASNSRVSVGPAGGLLPRG